MAHDEVNVLLLQPTIINLTILFILLLLLVLDSRSLTLHICHGVRRTSRSTSLLLRRELLSSRSLGLGVEILDLGLSEDTAPISLRLATTSTVTSQLNSHPRVAIRALVHIRIADHEQDVLRPTQRHPRNALDVLEPQLANRLARFLLVARVHRHGRSRGDARVVLVAGFAATARAGVFGFRGFDFVGKLFDARVGHGVELVQGFEVGGCD